MKCKDCTMAMLTTYKQEIYRTLRKNRFEDRTSTYCTFMQGFITKEIIECTGYFKKEKK